MVKTNKIVLIMTDTQRVDMVGCYGNPAMKTPNIDRLASQGIRFDRAYCCQPVCGPARSAIFTGTFPHTNGAWGNSMPTNQITPNIGQRLSDKGFHTAYIGKWHLDGGDYFGDGLCPKGWDPEYWYDMRCYLEELSPEDRVRSRKIETIHDEDFSEEFTYAHRCSNRSIDFLSKHNNSEFLLVVSYDEPHHPFLCPPQYVKMYENYEYPKSSNVWDSLQNKPEHHQVWAKNNSRHSDDQVVITNPPFLGCNSFVDHEIGRVLEAVDRYAPDALVIYTSDHGDMLQSHRLTEKGPVMYDEITRIPFIVRWPKVVPQNEVCPHPISHIDIVPTVLEAAGFKIPKPLQGESIIPTLKSPNIKQKEGVFIEFGRFEVDHDGFGGFQPIRCVFDGRYKMSINLLTSDELYDLEKDPEEMVNLIESEQHKKIRDELHDRILKWMNDTRDPFRGYYWERRPWRKDARKPTWDYTGMTRQREPDEGERVQLDYATGREVQKLVRKKEEMHKIPGV